MNLILSELLNSIIRFTEEELELISQRMRPKRFQKGAYLLREGEVCHEISFIIDGLIRQYHLQDGKELTTYIGSDRCVMYSISSFLQQNSSVEYIQSIEQSEVLCLSHASMQELYDLVPKWQVVGRYLAEKKYLQMWETMVRSHHIKARERYLMFLQSAPPKVVQRTPIQYIASCIGVRPETLSRIRKEIY